MEDARINKQLLHRARHLILVGVSRQDVLVELTDFGLEALEASQIVDAAERFVLVRNLCAGFSSIVLGALSELSLYVGWTQDPPQISFFKGFMGVIFVLIGVKFLSARRSGVA